MPFIGVMKGSQLQIIEQFDDLYFPWQQAKTGQTIEDVEV